jgi:hypothetical protein
MPTIITTPRPPLNLFEAVRVPITDVWTTMYEVPLYRIPATGPDPQRDVAAAAVMTGLIFTNTFTSPILLSVRILNAAGDPFSVLQNIQIPIGDYVLVDLNRQVLKTDEVLQAQCATGQSATGHFSFILNQREEFEVIA